MQDQELIDKLRKIERLYAGAATTGEKDAAAAAMARIKSRLAELATIEKPIEYKFRFADGWSKKLFLALLRRYELRPYRYQRQRHSTVMVRVPASFVNDTLWPEFLALSKVLQAHLDEITNRVIAQGIHEDSGEEVVVVGGEFLD